MSEEERWPKRLVRAVRVGRIDARRKVVLWHLVPVKGGERVGRAREGPVEEREQAGRDDSSP